MRRFGRPLRILFLTVMLLVAAVTASAIVVQTAWFKNWLRSYIVREANQYLNGELSIGRLGGNLFSGVALEQVVVAMDGKPAVKVEAIRLSYNVFEMFSNGVSIARISLNRPVVSLERRDGLWTIARLVKKRTEQVDRTGAPRPIAIQRIEITDGSVAVSGLESGGAVRAPHRFDHIDANLAFTYRAAAYTVDVGHVSFRASEPAIGLNALSGSISVDDSGVSLRKVALETEESRLSIDGTVTRTAATPVISFVVKSEKLSLPEIARVVPAVSGIPLQPVFEVKVSGPASRLAIDMNVRSAAGQVSAVLVGDLDSPSQSVTGDVVLRDFDLAPILRNPESRTTITGKASVSVRGTPLSNADSLRFSVALRSPHLAALGYAADDVTVRAQIAGPRITFDGKARAYGAAATATGFISLKGDRRPLVYDLRGVARHVDLRRLPAQVKAPRVASDINAVYQVHGTVAPGPGDTRQAVEASGRFEASTLEGMQIAAGSTGGVKLDGPDLDYWGDATVTQVNLRRIGEAFKITALGTERFESLLNGHVTAKVQGTAVRDMNLVAGGTLTDSSLFGGHIAELTFDTSLADDALQVTASGNVDHVDLKASLQRPSLDGQINGSLDARVTIANISEGVSADHVEATGRFEIQDSRVGPMVIDRATFDGDYCGSTATIRMLDVSGPVMTAQAHGSLALDESGQSNLILHAEAADLDEVGKLIDKPLAGSATVDGTVTGNRNELMLSGHATGNALKYGTAGALVLATDYTVHVPKLSAKEASISAATNANFVTIGGQHINELVAKTEYVNGQLTFDALGRQPDRSLSVAGTMALPTTQQEVRLQRLEAATRGLTWQLAPGTEPVIRYADNAVAVKDFQLQSGDQRVAVSGAFGQPGDALDITLANIDLAAVDAVLLRPPQFSGRLRASGRVTGTSDQPQAQADFQVTQGGFRQFHYADLSGTVNYGGKGVTVDAKLQQDASAWLTAKGYLPIALFKGPGNVPTAHGAIVSPEDSVNLQIESSPIQLGIIQGFTTALTNVTGTLQANLQVTGPADDPHPGGSIAVRDAAFTVGATGVNYSSGSGTIEFQGDRVQVQQFRVLDNRHKPLLVAGDLAIHERELGGVDVSVKTDEFNIIDNKIGNLRITSDLHIGGELAYPRVEGTLGISTGRINLDELLASTTDSAYSTSPLSPTTPSRVPVVEPASVESPTPSLAPGAEPASVENPTPSGASAAGPAAAGEAPAPGSFDALQMDIHVTVPDDLVVRASDLRVPNAPIGLGSLNITLGGDLWVSKTPWDRPRLTGPVNTVRGSYDFQGRRFEILRDGTLRFDGLDETEPILDIKTERVIQGVRTNVNIRGTLQHPEISLTSSPPLPESDILALIVFNQPASQIGAAQQISLAQRAQSMALGAIAGQLADSIGGGLDMFELKVAPESGAAAEVTIGQQVSQNLFVKVDQGIGDQSSTNVVIEYQMGKWLLLQSNWREGSTTVQPFQKVQGSGMDLIFFFSY